VSLLVFFAVMSDGRSGPHGDQLAKVTGCDDLSSIPVRFDVSYPEVHNAWIQGGCVGCHNVTMMGGLRLDDPATSMLGLIDVPSYRAPDVIRVVPGSPHGSQLMELMNCAPSGDFIAMPPGENRASLAVRALVFDWIAAGARSFDEDGNPVSDTVFLSGMESDRLQQGVLAPPPPP
jgi:hypothetical protein